MMEFLQLESTHLLTVEEHCNIVLYQADPFRLSFHAFNDVQRRKIVSGFLATFIFNRGNLSIPIPKSGALLEGRPMNIFTIDHFFLWPVNPQVIRKRTLRKYGGVTYQSNK